MKQDKQDHRKLNIVLALFCLTTTFFPACMSVAALRTATAIQSRSLFKPWQVRGTFLAGTYCLYRSVINADTALVRWEMGKAPHQDDKKSYLSFIPFLPKR
ncbi:MAG: hypothetical protein KBD64_01080 [Gammaproteobacteria bacterium]|nr:hypothetical protein [Gammaproteobacteria bacterium]